MISFLRRLIERAENQAPVLERRPRALFEPAPSRVAQRTAEDTSLKGVQVDEAVVARPQPTERRTSKTAPSRNAPQVDTLDESPAPVQVFRTPVERQRPMPEAIPAAVKPPSSPVERPFLLRPDVPTLEKQPGTHRVFASRAESTPPARPAASLPPPRIAAPNTTRTEPWPAPTEPGRLRPRVRHEDRPLLSSPPVRPPKDRTSGNTQAPIRNAFQPFARPAPAPAVVMAKARAATRLSPPVAVEGAASPITISIGRVDVRADAPPLRPGLRGAKPAGPRLQLEDYLNERSRGAR